MQDPCRNKRRKVSSSVAEVVGLAVELVGRVDNPLFPRAASPRTPTIAQESELNDAKEMLRAYAVKITELEKSRNEAIHSNEEALSDARRKFVDKLASKIEEHKVAVSKVRSEAKSAEDRLVAERDGDLSRYHGVLRPVCLIVKAGDESNSKHTDTLTKLHLLFEEGRKVAAPALHAGSSRDQNRILDREIALETKELELQTFLGLAAKNAKLRSETSRLRNSVKMLSRDSETVLPIREDVRDLKTVAQDVRSQAEALEKQNLEFESNIEELDARSIGDSAREQALIGINESLKSKLASTRVEFANTRWNAQTVVKDAEMAENDVSMALEVTSAKFSSAADGEVVIVEKKLVDALKRVSTNIEMKSKWAISRIRAAFERDDGIALRSVAISPSVLRSRLAEVRRGLPTPRDVTAASGGGAATSARGATVEPMAVSDVGTGDAPKAEEAV